MPGDEDDGATAGHADDASALDELEADGSVAAARPRLSSPQPLAADELADTGGVEAAVDSDEPAAYVVTEAAFEDEDAEDQHHSSSPMDE